MDDITQNFGSFRIWIITKTSLSRYTRNVFSRIYLVEEECKIFISGYVTGKGLSWFEIRLSEKKWFYFLELISFLISDIYL